MAHAEGAAAEGEPAETFDGILARLKVTDLREAKVKDLSAICARLGIARSGEALSVRLPGAAQLMCCIQTHMMVIAERIPQPSLLCALPGHNKDAIATRIEDHYGLRLHASDASQNGAGTDEAPPDEATLANEDSAAAADDRTTGLRWSRHTWLFLPCRPLSMV